MVDISDDRIQGGTGVGLATANERIMRDNEFHHSREKMFVVASSYTVPKGSALAVCSTHVLVITGILILVYFTAHTANADELAAGHGCSDEAGERREQPSAARPPPHDQGCNSIDILEFKA